MKINLLVLLMFLPAFSFCQLKKNTHPKPTEIQLIKKEALAWFKTVYVEVNFKDPYSYKLLKVDIYPISNKESLEKILEDYNRELSYADTTKIISDYYRKRQDYRTQVSNVRTYPTIYTQTDVDRAKKALDDERVKYEQLVIDKAEAENLLSRIELKNANKVHHYVLYIDCYSNNSYGNPVLGKFGLYYGRDGVIGRPFQLNDN